MKVKVGSKNPLKAIAVENAFSHYFNDIEIIPAEAESGVHHTPMSVEDAVKGAKNRAKQVFDGCDYSVGIEGTIIRFPSKTGYMLTAIAVIYNGKEFFVGGAPQIELPEKAVEEVQKGKELGKVFDDITGMENMKHKEGAIGHLTKGAITRAKQLEMAVICAMSRIINKEMYENGKP